jgi:DNA-binding NarL/FixJ family response regulator
MRLLIVDDHPLFRAALRHAVSQCAPGIEVAEAPDLATAHADLETHPETDLVSLDLHMPGVSGLAGLVALRCRHPAVAVVVVSAHDDPAVVRRALAHGAQGFIPKNADMEHLGAAFAAVFRCETWVPPALRAAVAAAEAPADEDLATRLASLSAQQYRVLEMVAQGLLNKQIADRLGIAERTVKAHVGDVFAKLGVRNRTQAGVLFQRLELSDPARAPV